MDAKDPILTLLRDTAALLRSKSTRCGDASSLTLLTLNNAGL